MPLNFTEEDFAAPLTFAAEDFQEKPPADKTLGSQLAVKIPEVIAEHDFNFGKDVPGLNPAEVETLRSLEKDIVLEEAKKRVYESPVKGVARGVQRSAVDAIESLKTPTGIGIGALAVAPELGVPAALARPALSGIMSGLAAKTIGEGTGTLSVPGGSSNEEATRTMINMALMGKGAEASGRMLAPNKPILPRAEQAARAAIESEKPNAIEEGQVPESNQPEYQRVEAQRLPAETGGGDSPQRVETPPEAGQVGGQAELPLEAKTAQWSELTKQIESAQTEPEIAAAEEAVNKSVDAGELTMPAENALTMQLFRKSKPVETPTPKEAAPESNTTAPLWKDLRKQIGEIKDESDLDAVHRQVQDAAREARLGARQEGDLQKQLVEASKTLGVRLLKITPADMGWGQPASEPVWRTITDQEAKSPTVLSSFLTKDARIEGTTEPVSTTRRLLVMQGKDGRVHIVSTYADGRYGVRVLDPDLAKTQRPNKQLRTILEKYKPLYSLLSDEPVKNFHQEFESLQDFYARFGDEAIQRASQHVEAAPEIGVEGQHPVPVVQPEVYAEPEGPTPTTGEIAAFRKAVTEPPKSPEHLRELLKANASRQVVSLLKKAAISLREADESLTPQKAYEKAIENLYQGVTKEAAAKTVVDRPGQPTEQGIPREAKVGVRPQTKSPGALGIVASTSLPAIEDIQAVTSAIKDAPSSMRRFWRAFSMQALPKMTESNREVGEAGARFAAAPQAGRNMGLLFAEKVTEGIKDPKFDLKLGVAIKEDNLRDIAQQGKPVTTLIGKENSPFKTEQEYQNFLRSPDAQKAIARHKQLWVEQKEPLYRKATDLAEDVELPGRGLQTGARINLTFIPEGAKGKVGVGGPRRSPLVRQAATLVRRTPFARQAKGTGTNYEGSYSETMANSFAKEYPVAAQHEFYKLLLDSGDAVLSGKEFPEGLKIKGEEIGPKAELMRLRAWQGQWMHVRRSLAPEFEAVTGLTPALRLPWLTPINNFLTTQSIRGFAEGSTHVANLMTKVFTGLGPTPNPMLNALIKSAGRADLLYSLPKVLIKGFSNQKEAMLELMKAGAAKEPYSGFLGPLLNGIDRGVRLVSADVYKKMAERGWVEKGETGLREFVNEVGNYNHRLQPRWISFLRETAQPFATAVHTFNVMGLRRMGLGPAAKAPTNPAALALRADIAGGIVGFVVLKSVIQHLLTGNNTGPPGTQLGNIGWIGDDKKLHQFPFARLLGYDRGLRITGLQGAIEAKRLGLSKNAALRSGAQGLGSAGLNYVTGPTVQFATRAFTGARPGIPMVQEAKVAPPKDNLAPLKTQAAENVKSALKAANPIVDMIWSRAEDKPLSEVAHRQFGRYTPGAPQSTKTIEALPKIIKAADMEKYAVSVAKEARKLPIMERGKFVIERLDKDGLAGPDRIAAFHAIRKHGVYRYE